MNDLLEYKRIKKSLHTRPFLENDLLLDEIEDFGKQCANKKLYTKLKRKYKWHRLWNPKHLAIGKAPNDWANRQKPLVSVIVPNYCHAPYLTERIECILNQTFQNFELIILDDCSQDNSRDIILKYKDHPRVSHIVLNEQNTGNTFLQWEKGVALAQGQYIWIAESDDYADETFLDSTMAMFCLHEDCVMVRTGSYQVNEHGRILTRDWDVWKEDETVHYYSGHDYIRHNMLHFNYIYNASMVVFRKDIFHQIDKSYQQMRYTGDWLCWIEMLTKGPICVYHRKLNYFRQHQNKVSARSKKTNKGIIDQINVLAHAIKHVKSSAFRKMMIRGEQYYVSSRCFDSDDYDPEIKKACFKTLRNNLHATIWDYRLYKFFSWFDFLPFIPSQKNDKYK
ncbi:MAG: glycosyltransferase family 2 protein [Prevotella sp.]|nr:glycosyltransferase family 2 protein [Prevotella sp.]